MSISQRVSRGLRICSVIVAAAIALAGCSDTDADYWACQAKAYDVFKQSIWKSDDALEYVRVCMMAAGYEMTAVCVQTAREGDQSLSSVALLPNCFERPWWKGWRSYALLAKDPRRWVPGITVTIGDSITSSALESYFRGHAVDGHHAVAIKKRNVVGESYLATVHGYPTNLSVCEQLIAPYNKDQSLSAMGGEYFCEELR